MSNKRDSDQVELECQFILRLPPEPAKALREMLKSGSSSLKDRLSIKLENDVRYGEVRVDHWLLHAKVVDLPTIVESLKTIDNKSFYKTADLCQMMICKEEDDQTTDEESPTKHKKKDPNKVEKKFLWPHGITPPLKNVRKRRFRKTLKKKYVEAPEVEKEVKRLLRGDMDAVSVKWEVITEEDDKKITIKEEPLEQDELELLDASANNTQNTVAERDIFGEAVSDSDEEESHLNLVDIEENSRLSPDDSRISDSMSLQMSEERGDERLVTHFSGNMFQVKAEPEEMREFPSHHQKEVISSHGMSSGLPQGALLNDFEGLESRLEEVRCQLTELKARRAQQEMEVANIENIALKQRFQEILDQLLQEQLDKEQEFQELSELLQM